MKEIFKRGVVSFSISAFIGLLVNLILNIISNHYANKAGDSGFIAMPPEFLSMFPTPVIAAYVNVLLYGLIGFTFAFMTFVYEIERLGFLFQSIIYFFSTLAVALIITVFIWQLHHNAIAFAMTLTGYFVTHVIMFVVEYKELKKDIKMINSMIKE